MLRTGCVVGDVGERVEHGEGEEGHLLPSAGGSYCSWMLYSWRALPGRSDQGVK